MIVNKFLIGRSGIYGIRNTVNNKIYIGKTKCMYRRCSQYIYDFKNRSIGHINDYLYNAMNKVGFNKFEFFPLEFAEIDKLSELELSWMVKLKSTDRNYGYNIRMDSSTGMITSDITSLKISENLKRQWASGVRDGHSSKLKSSWANDPDRKRKQSMILSQIKTKYEYKVTHPCGKVERCEYARLKELNIHGVMSNFKRRKSNDVMIKGFNVVRYSKGES